MDKKFILSLDQGTSSSRAVLFNKQQEVVGIESQEFETIYPSPGLVEQNPEVIWETQINVALKLLNRLDINPDEIASIGITNQRETTIIWDKNTGEPIYNAIVWQDTRTSDYCELLKQNEIEDDIFIKTGLRLDSYFSATKINWILKNVNGAKEKAKNNELLFGTVDTWLLWKLTNGKAHYTDVSNASRTLVYDIEKLEWSNSLLELFEIPTSLLPKVLNSSDEFGITDKSIFGCEIPIASMIGDQQSALFGQHCFEAGSVKNTYGTGCFMLMNTGNKIIHSKSGLLTTIAWSINNKPKYALEGSVFIAGAAIQWLRDGLKIIQNAKESEEFALSVKDSNGVYFVPAFNGLGAPYWDMKARGAVVGLTRGVTDKHIVRAALESIAFQTKDVINAMVKDSDIELKELKVDGGVSVNNFLIQFQSDILNIKLIRPKFIETTALGAALLAGLAVGFWTDEEITNSNKSRNEFFPQMSDSRRITLYNEWKSAVNQVKSS